MKRKNKIKSIVNDLDICPDVIFQILLLCSRPMMSHTFFIVQKKRKEKENQYKIRKIKEKKNQNCLVFQYPITLSMSFDEIKTIENWPKLRKIKDMQAFLRFTNFCHHFIYTLTLYTVKCLILSKRCSLLLQFLSTRYLMFK